VETRLSLPFPAKGRLALPPHMLCEIESWAATPESREVSGGGPVTDVMAAKNSAKSPSKAQTAAVSARLRAMVEDVERWPLPDSLLKVIDELETPRDAAKRREL
jgi:hypothetical protein